MTNDTLRAVAEVLRALAWPAVATFVAIFFRNEVRDLAKRLRRGGGAEFDPIPQPTIAPQNLLTAPEASSLPVSSATSAALESIPRTRAIEEWEEMIRASSWLRDVVGSAEREKVLLRMLARALLSNQFDQTEASVWASQLALLEYLNSRRDGEAHSKLRELFYERAVKEYPSWYDSYPYEGWIGFLRRNGMITTDHAGARITDVGIEYLAWRIQQAKPPRMQG